MWVVSFYALLTCGKKVHSPKITLSIHDGARRFRSIEPINKKHMAGELLCAYVPYKPI